MEWEELFATARAEGRGDDAELAMDALIAAAKVRELVTPEAKRAAMVLDCARSLDTWLAERALWLLNRSWLLSRTELLQHLGPMGPIPTIERSWLLSRTELLQHLEPMGSIPTIERSWLLSRTELLQLVEQAERLLAIASSDAPLDAQGVEEAWKLRRALTLDTVDAALARLAGMVQVEA